MPVELDNIDRRLLALVQEDASLSSQCLAERVGSSRSSIQRRLKRLRAEDVIKSEIAVLSNTAIGCNIMSVISVKLKSVQSHKLDAFRNTMLAVDAVQQCYYVAGEIDFIVIASAADMSTYEKFTRNVLEENQNIERCQSNIVVDPVKIGLSLPF